MGSLVVLGEVARISAFGLAGATVMAAEDSEAVWRAWEELTEEVSLVVLTERAAASLRDAPPKGRVLTVVMPS